MIPSRLILPLIFGAKYIRRVNVQQNAQICKGVERGKFIPLDVMRNRLLRNAQSFPYFGLRHIALRDGFR